MARKYDTKTKKWVETDDSSKSKKVKWKSLPASSSKGTMGFVSGTSQGKGKSKRTYRYYNNKTKKWEVREWTAKSSKSNYSGSSYESYNNWWEGSEEQGGYYQSFKKTKGKSASSYWSGRFGGETWYSYGGADKNYKYRAALRSVGRSANLVSNTVDGKERHIQVRWSDGKSKNNTSDNYVYLSPDVVNKKTCLKKEWNGDELTDVLVAQALSESTLKRTATNRAQGRVARVKNKKSRELTEAVWYAAEAVNARDEVLKDYPGFKDYFASHLAYHSDDAKRRELERVMREEKPTSEMATKAVIWNLLHPTDQIEDIPAAYQAAVEAAEESIGDAESSIDRAKAAVSSIERFGKLWPIEEDPPEEDEGGGGGGGGDGSDLTDGMGLDRSAMSSQIDNETNPELRSQTAEDSDATDEDGNPVDPNFDGGSRDVPKVVEADITANSADRVAYGKRTRFLHMAIQGLKNRLKFRNETASIHEKGLRTGHLDEGSLFKLGFHSIGYNDPRVFEREEIPDKANSAFILLVDESGSMAGYVNSRGWYDEEEPIYDAGSPSVRYQAARDIAITITEALEAIDGADFSVIGHTAEGSGQDGFYSRGVLCHHYYTPENPHKHAISRIGAFSNNLDGYAIKHAVQKVIEWYPKHESRLVIHISDGQPAGYGYGGKPAFEHMRRVSSAAARKNVRVIGVCVGPEFTEEKCVEMYGENNYVITQSINSAFPAIANLIVRTVAKGAQL